MSRNRTEFIRDALGSLLAQEDAPVQVRVSDNSSDDEVATLLAGEFSKVPVRFRRPNVSAYDHLNLILSEIETPYFMIFHDDDVLHKHAINQLCEALRKHPDAAAAAPNAFVLRSGRRSRELFNPSLRKDAIIRTPQELALRYLDFAKGINPFPGYLYRTEQIRGLRFAEADLGQYADLAFLNEVCARGPLVWLSTPLMDYRKHADNHSNTIDLLSAKKVVRFYESRNLVAKNAPQAKLFRYWNHFFYLRSAPRRKLRFRRKQLALVFLYFALHPRSFIRRCLQKIGV